MYAQGGWTKGDRGNAYEECMSAVKNREELSEDQQKSICLCYLGEITQRYAKNEWANKIEVEIERIQEGTIINCAKNIGIDLINFQQEGNVSSHIAAASFVQKVETPVNNPSEATFAPISVTKEAMYGEWTSTNCTYWLLQTGEMVIAWNRGGVTKGTWTLEGDVFTCRYNFNRIIYKILSFNSKSMVYKALNGTRETYTAKKNDQY